jgi:hypothetical protein
MNEHLLTELSRRRQAELLHEAERERLAAHATERSPRTFFRRGRVTVEIRLSGDLRPDQIDQIFASLARHLG